MSAPANVTLVADEGPEKTFIVGGGDGICMGRTNCRDIVFGP